MNDLQEKLEAEEESKEGDKDDTWAKLGDTISSFFNPDEEVRICSGAALYDRLYLLYGWVFKGIVARNAFKNCIFFPAQWFKLCIYLDEFQFLHVVSKISRLKNHIFLI